MNALLRKDWRLYRPAVIGSLVVLAGVYLIGILPLLQEDPKAGPYARPRQVVNVVLLATGVTAIFAAVFGASAFAVERRDRTAEFFAMLPVSRARILASKAAVAAAFLLALWAAHLTVALLAFHSLGEGARHTTEFAYAFAGIATAALMMFSLAWFFSAFLTGAAIPFALGFGGTIASAEVIRQLIENIGLHGYAFVRTWIVWSCVVAVASFVAGAVHYARRVAP
jgi:ABC-type transport system involved in multi-copper enzyme maturation permease subunit